MKSFIRRLPGWVFILIIATLFILYSFMASPKYQETLQLLKSGILVTIQISIMSLVIALSIGMVAGLGRASGKPIISFPFGIYVEVFRGIPTFVTVIYVAFVVAPLIATLLGRENISEVARVIIALGISMGAYMAEDIRAGIESIGRGQMEAALSIGMSYLQAMRFVILPQAIRNVTPTLGNDFISLLKDSSLGSLIAVNELTQLGRIRAGLTYDSLTAWNLVSILYLAMTLSLSAILASVERKMMVE
jgi:polar amino acid transport system permease protein